VALSYDDSTINIVVVIIIITINIIVVIIIIKHSFRLLPSVGKTSDYRRNNVRQPELGDGRDLFHHVVAEKDSFGDEGARVTGNDRDRLARVNEVSGDVMILAGCVRVDGVRLTHILAQL